MTGSSRTSPPDAGLGARIDTERINSRGCRRDSPFSAEVGSKREFLFGAAYYDEYNQEDRLEKDMQLMRKAGMNAIRIAESTWSVEEPRCGEFDFSHVTRVIEAAARHGIGVIIGTPTYAVPKWLHDLDPEILGVNAFGPRQNMDIANPTYRFYAECIIRELRDYVPQAAQPLPPSAASLRMRTSRSGMTGSPTA